MHVRALHRHRGLMYYAEPNFYHVPILFLSDTSDIHKPSTSRFGISRDSVGLKTEFHQNYAHGNASEVQGFFALSCRSSDDFGRQLITFANSLDPDHVGNDLYPF